MNMYMYGVPLAAAGSPGSDASNEMNRGCVREQIE